MAVKIRLKRVGKKKQPYYRVVVADARSPRDGRFIEEIGTYNPHTDPSTFKVDAEKVKDWMAKGAQPTDTVKKLLKYNGILEKAMKDLLKSVIEPLVQYPEELVIGEEVRGREIVLTVSAHPEDVGRVIGRGGRRAQAVRAIMKAKGAMDNKRISVDILS